MTDPARYERVDDAGAFVAQWPDGTELRVHQGRARAYPGLRGPAPENTRLYRALERALPRRATVLDVGCGAGTGAMAMAARGQRVTAVDPSMEAITFARACSGHGVNRGDDATVRWVLGSVDSRDVSGTFDEAVVVDVLGHVEHPAALLSSVRARLGTTGGMTVLEARADPEQNLVGPVRRAFGAEQLESVLVRAGFDTLAQVTTAVEFVGYTARVASVDLAWRALAVADDASVPASEAVDAVGQALEGVDDPSAARELLLAFGALHLRLGDLDSAAGTYVGALRLSPRSARGLLGLGLVAERVGRPAEAVRLFEKAVGVDASWPEVWCALGALRLAHRADARGAEEAFDAAMHLAPGEHSVVEARAQALGPASVSAEARAMLAGYAATAG